MKHSAKFFLASILFSWGCTEQGGVVDLDSVDEHQLDFEMADGVVVVDSTVLYLQSDSAELRDGVFVFRVLSSPPSIVSTNIIVGAQGEGFLRRVTSVAQAQDKITLRTVQASLADAIVRGSFSFPILFSPGTSLFAVSSSFRGAQQDLIREDLALGVSLASTGISLDNTVLYDGPVCQGSSGTSSCTNLTAKITQGLIDFNHKVDVSGEFDFSRSKEFSLVADGDISLDVVFNINAGGAFGYQHDLTLASFSAPFKTFIGQVPVVGLAKFKLRAYLDVGTTGPVRIESGLKSQGSVKAGLEYNALVFSPVFEPQGSYEPVPSDISGRGDFEVRLDVRPEVSIVFYNLAGPFLGIGPYLKFDGSAQGIRWQAQSVAGIAGELGASLQVLSWDIVRWDHDLMGPETVIWEGEGENIQFSSIFASSRPAWQGGLITGYIQSKLYKVDVSGTDEYIGVIESTPNSGGIFIEDVEAGLDGRLWGMSKSYLYQIDTLTAEVKGYAWVRNVNHIRAITVDNRSGSETEGMLFGMTSAFVPELVLIDPETALWERIGYIELTGLWAYFTNFPGDLAFSPDGNLYVTMLGGTNVKDDLLLILDPSTAAITRTRILDRRNIGDLLFVGNELYGFVGDRVYGYTNKDSGSIVRIDPDTGKTELIRRLRFDPSKSG